MRCLTYEEKFEKFFTTHYPIPSKCIMLTVDNSSVEYRKSAPNKFATLRGIKSVAVTSPVTTWEEDHDIPYV
jgi:hypothetical protein